MPQTPILSHAKIIPVLKIEQLEHALPIAQALQAGGITHIEITLRTDAALGAIEHIASRVPDIKVGAGTVLNKEQFTAAQNAGAQFIFSPGFENNLASFAKIQQSAYIPGVSSASDIQQAIALNYHTLKLFPAQLLGGTKLLEALHAPFPHVQFCPTGGIRLENIKAYAALPYVCAVGGSWLVTPELIKNKDWDQVTCHAQLALQSFTSSKPLSELY